MQDPTNHIFNLNYTFPRIDAARNIDQKINEASAIFNKFLKDVKREEKNDPELKAWGEPNSTIQERQWAIGINRAGLFSREYHSVARHMFLYRIYRKAAFRKLLLKIKNLPAGEKKHEDYFELQAYYAYELNRQISRERSLHYNQADLKRIYNEEYDRMYNTYKKLKDQYVKETEIMKQEETEMDLEQNQRLYKQIQEIKRSRNHLAAPGVCIIDSHTAPDSGLVLE